MVLRGLCLRRALLSQSRGRKKLAGMKPPPTSGIEEAWEYYGKPTYSRNSYEHMIGFDHWRKWTNYRTHVPMWQETTARPIWPPFQPNPRDAHPEHWDRTTSTAFNELPPPSPQALADSAVDPRVIAQQRRHLLPPDSPILHPDYFALRPLLSIRAMMNARLHLGHKLGTLHDRMRPFLFGQRLGTCIFDLEQTREALFLALNFTAHLALRGGIVLFCSLNRDHQRLLQDAAEDAREFAHTRQWTQGTFTDSRKKFGAVVRLPDLVILTSTQDALGHPHPVIAEAAKMSIPTIAINDSNTDPTHITYPIPANDDSQDAVLHCLQLFSTAIRAGKDASARLSLQLNPQSPNAAVSA